MSEGEPSGAPARRRPAWPARTLTVLGAVLLALGILAGVVNRTVLDGPRFARSLDVARQDPVVSEQIARQVTDQVLQAAPDLVAVRPLLQVTTASLVRSGALGPAFRTAAQTLHGDITGRRPADVVWQLVDVGASVRGVLQVVAPSVAAKIPDTLSVTLTQARSTTVFARVARWSRVVGVGSWLLPLLALLALVAGWFLAPDRRRAATRTGWGVVAAGGGLGLVAVVGTIVAGTADQTTLRGVLTTVLVRQVDGTVWWAAGITAVAGVLLVAASSGRLPRLATVVAGARSSSLLRPGGRRRRVAAVAGGLVLAALGLAALLRPGLVFGLIGILVAIACLLLGIGEATAGDVPAARAGTSGAGTTGAGEAGATTPPGAAADRTVARRMRAPALGLLGVALLVVLVAVDAQRARPALVTAASASSGCNGHVQLCSRRYDQVAYPATHNAMAAADEPGWFIPEQPTGLVGQLDAGIRTLLVDVWYGTPSSVPGIVATAAGSHDAALASMEEQFGPGIAAELERLHLAAIPPGNGPTEPYLCHGLCEIGSTRWEPEMARVRAWVQAHPREVVTFIVEDYISPADTAKVFGDAGLLPYVHTQQAGQPWPTLGEMIASGRRVVVFNENHAGGSTYPWQMSAFDAIQDTPFSNPTVADLSCTLNRGQASDPLLLLNYWLANGFRTLRTDAQKINAYDQLGPYVTRCQTERGTLPNFVAVNFYDEGDLFRVVDQLNGLS